MPIYKLLCLLIIVSKLHSWFLFISYFIYLFIVASVMDKHKVDINLKVDKLTKSLKFMSTLCLSITDATINK